MIKSSVVSQTCGYRTSFGSRAVESKFLKLAEPLLIGAVQAVLSAYSPKAPSRITLRHLAANAGSRPERTL